MSGRVASTWRPLAGALALFALLALGTEAYGSFAGDSGTRLMTLMLIDLIAVLGLQTFVGNSGVLSFGHVGIAGLAAYATAILCTPAALKASVLLDAPLGLAHVELAATLATVIGVLFGVACGMLVGLVVLRLSGMAASIVSLAALIVVNTLLTNASSVTGGAEGFFGIPPFSSRALLLVLVLGALVLARLFRESRVGRQLQAGRDDELAAAALGVRLVRVRLAGWAVSLVLVSLSGALRAQFLGTITPEEFSFELTFTTLAMLIVGGSAGVTGAVAGTLLITAASEGARVLGDGASLGFVRFPTIGGLPTLVLGLTLVIVMALRSEGLFGRFELDELLPRRRAPRAAPVPAPTPARRGDDADVLRAQDVEVRFGRIVAVAGASLEVARGEVVGLIGPNGAGKSTLLNAISGVFPPTAGAVLLGAQDLTRQPPWQISRAGISRTFQNIRLFDHLTAAENVQAAAFAHGAADGEAVMALLAEAGIAELAQRFPSTLSYGHQRRLELARALATAPAFLLLDEPAAGMNASESQELGATIQRIRERHGCGIVVIDHDLPFVFDLCDRVYVLAEGRVLASGTPEQVRSDARVIESYLGAGAPAVAVRAAP